MNRDLMFSSKSDLWCTPKDLFESLNKEFNFNLDVCATDKSKKCQRFYSVQDDALSVNWWTPTGTIAFCNPPYGRSIGKWVKKCHDEGSFQDSYYGCEKVIMLIPSRTDTKWFHDYILGKSEIRFIKGRLKFINLEDKEKFTKQGTENKISPAPFPSMIIIFGNKPQIYSADKLGKKEL